MNNRDKDRVKTNDVIEDLKSSITNLIDLAKSLQSLSGRLSLIGDECKNINNMSKQFQSNLYKMQKSINVIELQRIDDTDSNFWCSIHPKVFKQLLEVPNQRLNKHWSFERVGATFKKYLSDSQHDFNPYDVLFNFLFYISRCNGYVYGGFVRDFLVPVLIYGQNVVSVDFKDIDIWFSNQSQADDFVNSFNQKQKLVQLIELYDSPGREEYGCGGSFTRKKLNFCFEHKPLFLVDVMVARQLPVNDFSVNLLMFKAKDPNFTNASLSWFSVGEDYDGEYYKYSPLILIEMIAVKNTDLLKGYCNFSQITKDYKQIVKMRRQRMVEWGWTILNLKDHPIID